MPSFHSKIHYPPKVTIGLPVYNGENFLGQAIQSLLNQSFKDFELIISDNGSDDATPDICAHYSRLDTRITYLREPENRGAAWNYSRLVAEAKGEYFKWAAHDDECAPDFIACCVDALDKNQDAALAYARSIHVNAEGRTIGLYHERLNVSQKQPYRRLARLTRNLGYCNVVFGVIRLSELKKTNLIGSHLGSDRTLLAELALLGKFYQVEKFLFYKRSHPKMSLRANRNQRDLRIWFDPKQRDVKDYDKYTRLNKEQFKMILRSELPPFQKTLCILITLNYWYPRRFFPRTACSALIPIKRIETDELISILHSSLSEKNNVKVLEILNDRGWLHPLNPEIQRIKGLVGSS